MYNQSNLLSNYRTSAFYLHVLHKITKLYVSITRFFRKSQEVTNYK